MNHWNDERIGNVCKTLAGMAESNADPAVKRALILVEGALRAELLRAQLPTPPHAE
jgi:hypothetical protein